MFIVLNVIKKLLHKRGRSYLTKILEHGDSLVNSVPQESSQKIKQSYSTDSDLLKWVLIIITGLALVVCHALVFMIKFRC